MYVHYKLRKSSVQFSQSSIKALLLHNYDIS